MGNSIIIKHSIHQEDITVLKLCAVRNMAEKIHTERLYSYIMLLLLYNYYNNNYYIIIIIVIVISRNHSE